jgi:hypothetical protein
MTRRTAEITETGPIRVQMHGILHFRRSRPGGGVATSRGRGGDRPWAGWRPAVGGWASAVGGVSGVGERRAGCAKRGQDQFAAVPGRVASGTSSGLFHGAGSTRTDAPV